MCKKGSGRSAQLAGQNLWDGSEILSLAAIPDTDDNSGATRSYNAQYGYSGMSLPPRRIVWFAAAILVPSAALLYLGLRLLAQEDTIAHQRALEVRERQTGEIRLALLSRLEPLRLAPAAPPDVAFHGLVRNGRVLLAWELQPAVAAIRQAMQDSSYQSSLRTSAAPAGAWTGAPAGFLALQHAVSLARDAQSAQADALFDRLARLPATVTDDFAVPLALYTIPRLPPRNRATAAAALLDSVAANPHALSPTAFRMALALAHDNGLEARIRGLTPLLEDAEAAEQFQGAYSSTGGASTTRWQNFGTAPYLIGYTAVIPGEFTFRAVRASTAAANLAGRPRFSLDSGEFLGDPFPGLRVTPSAVPGSGFARQRPFIFTVLGLAFSMTFFGGLLLWRDFRRDAALARLRTEFVASVSHELRTPLTSIRLFTEALHDNPEIDPATRQDYLATMLRENERLSRLVENVLEFSRIERDSQTYHLRPVSLQSVIGQVLSSLEPLLTQGGFRLHTSIDPDLPAVQADPDALGQAIFNLLSNAMKYSGSARDLRLEATLDGPHAVIRVTDRGAGIPVAEQRRIFDSFYRTSAPGNSAIRALPGLALVRRQHGHGGGCGCKAHRPRIVHPPPPVPAGTPPERILIVEDEPPSPRTRRRLRR